MQYSVLVEDHNTDPDDVHNATTTASYNHEHDDQFSEMGHGQHQRRSRSRQQQTAANGRSADSSQDNDEASPAAAGDAPFDMSELERGLSLENGQNRGVLWPANLQIAASSVGVFDALSIIQQFERTAWLEDPDGEDAGINGTPSCTRLLPCFRSKYTPPVPPTIPFLQLGGMIREGLDVDIAFSPLEMPRRQARPPRLHGRGPNWAAERKEQLVQKAIDLDALVHVHRRSVRLIRSSADQSISSAAAAVLPESQSATCVSITFTLTTTRPCTVQVYLLHALQFRGDEALPQIISAAGDEARKLSWQTAVDGPPAPAAGGDVDTEERTQAVAHELTTCAFDTTQVTEAAALAAPDSYAVIIVAKVEDTGLAQQGDRTRVKTVTGAACDGKGEGNGNGSGKVGHEVVKQEWTFAQFMKTAEPLCSTSPAAAAGGHVEPSSRPSTATAAIDVIRQDIVIDDTLCMLQHVFGMNMSTNGASPVSDVSSAHGLHSGNATAAGTYSTEDGASSAQHDGGNLTTSEGECIICMTETRTHATLPCRHMCFCGECALLVSLEDESEPSIMVTARKQPRCPICRCVITSVVRVVREAVSKPE